MRTENRIELTDRWLRNVEPAATRKRETKWDVIVPGLGVRITDKGAVSFFIMKRMAGHPSPERITLGRYPVLGLAEARGKAKAQLGIIEQGKDPREVEAAQRAAEAAAKAAQQVSTFRVWAYRFKAGHLYKVRPRGKLRSRRINFPKMLVLPRQRMIVGSMGDGLGWKLTRRVTIGSDSIGHLYAKFHDCTWTTRPLGGRHLIYALGWSERRERVVGFEVWSKHGFRPMEMNVGTCARPRPDLDGLHGDDIHRLWDARGTAYVERLHASIARNQAHDERTTGKVIGIGGKLHIATVDREGARIRVLCDLDRRRRRARLVSQQRGGAPPLL